MGLNLTEILEKKLRPNCATAYSGVKIAATTVSGFNAGYQFGDEAILGIQISEGCYILNTPANAGMNLATDTAPSTFSGIAASGIFYPSNFDKALPHIIILQPSKPWLAIDPREAIECEVRIIKLGNNS